MSGRAGFGEDLHMRKGCKHTGTSKTCPLSGQCPLCGRLHSCHHADMGVYLGKGPYWQLITLCWLYFGVMFQV